jgi:hypothetical protein
MTEWLMIIVVAGSYSVGSVHVHRVTEAQCKQAQEEIHRVLARRGITVGCYGGDK